MRIEDCGAGLLYPPLQVPESDESVLVMWLEEISLLLARLHRSRVVEYLSVESPNRSRYRTYAYIGSLFMRYLFIFLLAGTPALAFAELGSACVAFLDNVQERLTFRESLLGPSLSQRVGRIVRFFSLPAIWRVKLAEV